MRLLNWAFFALVLLTAAVAGPTLPAGSTPVPCSDPRGCPDLVVDETRFVIGTQRNENFSPGSCAVQEGMVQSGSRQVMRFTFNTPNIGLGDLRVGSPSDHPEWFVWAACHGHYHFREYADYRLWTTSGYTSYDGYRDTEPAKTHAQIMADHPELASQFVVGNKGGFCIIDIVPNPVTTHGSVIPDPLPEYTSCSNDQGINKGWADEYLFTLDGQWVDVTTVAAGAYILEAEVNAERLYVELNYANNRISLPVVVT